MSGTTSEVSRVLLDKVQVREVIARRVARELADGDFVNLGIGLPTAVPQYLPGGVQVILSSENGIVQVGSCTAQQTSPYVVDAGGQHASCLIGGAFIDSATSFGLIRGGHVDVTVLGALQVDAAGNLANWIIPGKLVPGMGGAMDLVAGAKRVIVAMEHTQRGAPKILKACTLPLTAVARVNLIVTEMAVIEVTDAGLLLTEINPAFTIDEVRAATGAELAVLEQVASML